MLSPQINLLGAKIYFTTCITEGELMKVKEMDYVYYGQQLTKLGKININH